MVLIGPGGAPLAEGQEEGEALILAADISLPGRHLLRIRAEDPLARSMVQLRVDAAAVEDAEALACEHPTRLPPGQPAELPRSLPVQRFAVSCGQEQTTDYLASFELAEPARITLQATGAVALAVRAECDDPGSELSCTSDREVLTLEDVEMGTGTWYVVVQSFDFVPPEILLTVQ